MEVFCYRNLMRRGVVWSVKDKRTGLVVDRSSYVTLRHCWLRVSAAGRARVLRDKRKNVHAGIQGERVQRLPKNLTWRRVQYNPYENNTFVYSDTGKPVEFATYVKLTETGCYVA